MRIEIDLVHSSDNSQLKINLENKLNHGNKKTVNNSHSMLKKEPFVFLFLGLNQKFVIVNLVRLELMIRLLINIIHVRKVFKISRLDHLLISFVL